MSRPAKSQSPNEDPERSGGATFSVPGTLTPREVEAKSVLNQGTLARLRELSHPGEPSILGELIDMFIAETPRQIEALRRAIREGNVTALRRVAHTLKGSSGNLGADRLSKACGKLERLAKDGVVDGTADLLADVETEFHEAEKHLVAEKSK
jgi:HPt (histidine-containing phosphotransfer) domain-containing protein